MCDSNNLVICSMCDRHNSCSDEDVLREQRDLSKTTTLIVSPVGMEPFEVTGENYSYVNGIHYLKGESYPDFIAKVKR